MIMSSYNILAILLIVISYTQSAAIPERYSEITEDWSDDDNLVEPPPNLMLFPHVYDNQKSKLTPQNRLKAVIKAIYHYNTMNTLYRNANIKNDVQEDNSNETDETLKIVDEIKDKKTQSSSDIKEDDKFPVDKQNTSTENTSTEETDEVGDNLKEEKQYTEEMTTQEITTPQDEQTEQTTQKPEVLLEDLVDSIVQIPSIWVSDKSHKYTHSIRRGYGVPIYYSRNIEGF